MRTITIPRSFSLYIADLDTQLRILNSADGVVIHASRDNVSESRKICLIRYLAAEGWIPGRYEWFSEAAQLSPGLAWIVSGLPEQPKDASPWRQTWRSRRNLCFGLLALLWMTAVMVAGHFTSNSHGL